MADYKSTHTGLEIDQAVDNATLVVANPTLSEEDEDELKTINIAGVKYKLAGGTVVVANPGSGDTALTTIQIEGVNYKIEGGSGGAKAYFHYFEEESE